MRYSNNVVNNCLMAWAIEGGAVDARRGLERVEAHYARLYAEELWLDTESSEHMGIALLQRPERRLRWPLWSADGAIAVATLSIPLGPSDLASGEPGRAALELGSRVAREPRLVERLVPPVVMAVFTKEERKLTLVNDVVGVGRLYEMRCDWGAVWSNRLGALPVFAGTTPQVEASSWQIFAAAGWFLGKTTPLADCVKVEPGSRILAKEGGQGVSIASSADDLRRPLVEPRRSRFDFGSRRLEDSADRAAAELHDVVQRLGQAWEVPLAVSLTGGRDSRVSAAAVLSAKADAAFNTGDQVPGEVDAVRGLIAHAPVAMDHTVHGSDAESDDDVEREASLAERTSQIHLVHDGMRNPQELRRSVQIPHGPPPPPTLSGHGGELGHGFYYGDKRKLKRLMRGGDEALTAQLEKNARRKHSAATEESYELYMRMCERTLDAGRQHGLSGPPLLDWFYMAERLPYRSGLGARSGRWSACVTPAFIRGAFDLTPRERLNAKFHRMVIAKLVPEWSDVPFFKDTDPGASMPEVKRDRIWEKEPDASEVEEILAGGRSWPDIFDRDRVISMWSEVRSGEGSADYEHIFDRIVWREYFDDHVQHLARSAEVGGPIR